MDNDLAKLLRSVIREELEPVNERLERIETEQTGLKQEVQIVKQDQELIKRAVLDTNERVIRMESILENQHRIIELLSARSIEQEALIKRIK
ncbi:MULTISPECIES: hypothetical protein [Paenibacillus]|jgi:uncharacterized protein (DUF3084 family)|uniref:hypothetical protein n=1 Tax=Paenibacillus TaxID=44249 RepID=UPI00096D0824|nr:hypothetical protein [Paenibacillus sp. FSL H8-0259]OMF26891.1 hypothetical protein BK132_18265 [Paenibacillus sp. FSL H8-0259]